MLNINKPFFKKKKNKKVKIYNYITTKFILFIDLDLNFHICFINKLIAKKNSHFLNFYFIFHSKYILNSKNKFFILISYFFNIKKKKL